MARWRENEILRASRVVLGFYRPECLGARYLSRDSYTSHATKLNRTKNGSADERQPEGGKE
jgi:hypothetical protein